MTPQRVEGSYPSLPQHHKGQHPQPRKTPTKTKVTRLSSPFSPPLRRVARSHHPCSYRTWIAQQTNNKATKAVFFKIKSVCSLSGIIAEQPRKRALPGQRYNCQSYGHSSKHRFNPARCVKCLGNHSTAQCTRNKDIDGPPACVLCKQKGHTVNYLGYPRAPKRAPPPKKPRRAERARAHVLNNSKFRPRSGWTTQRPPAAKQNQTSTTDDLKQLMSIISIIDT
ncbi:hypothetical protein EVAR_4452_1 [Eumeta japonica]|uniref:Nucleic-acid-binding protein from transposon X-element n=1 Tax=Eumeta variegata TaxID=151549 RepID=A0A4C1T198_EUMVA|nr:hypothetical protein EVAR_4452_1 [Eumeta japonica]